MVVVVKSKLGLAVINKSFMKCLIKSQIILLTLLTLIFVGANLSTVFAAAVSQAYKSTKTLTLGTVVSVKPNGGELEETSLDNESKLVGVVVGTVDSVIDVQPSGTDVRVGVSGQVKILVTDISGNIKAGDNLVISPIKGVAAKDSADTKAIKYIATANENFDSMSANSHKVKISLNDGTSKEVEVGVISAKMNLVDRPNDAILKKDNFFVALISRLIGRKVNRNQLIAATVVFVIAFIVTGSILQSSIRGSFVALGRNPLSKTQIIRNLFRITAICLLIFEVGITAAYVILVI